MPTRAAVPAGAPAWIDLMSSDVASSRAFYAALFGWTALESSEEFGGYFMFTANGVPVAGCMPQPETPPGPDAWSTYLATQDVQQTVELATAGGGTVLVPPMPVASLGTMAVLTDPTGATFGLWQAEEFAGLTVLGEIGTASWFELHTGDFPGALRFYRDALGWETSTISDSDEFRYAVVLDGADQVAGVMDSTTIPFDDPTEWSVYFAVTDADAAGARVTELGGTVVAPAMDTPYGRLAGAIDPTGAPFRLAGPNVGTSTAG